jgi:UDP-N-acetylmuramoyl-tripeptide--D-alanyl-D-alanine ligase
MPLHLIALVWLIGINLRIYQQARFYQIEEYQNARYGRWLLAQWGRWLPLRPLIAWALGSLTIFALSTQPTAENDLLPALISLISAVIAILPPRSQEVKKKLRRTPRLKRMLGAAFVVVLIAFWVGLPFLIGKADPSALLRVMVFGFILFLGAPLLLMAGNLLMAPVEAFNRRRFIQQAQTILTESGVTVIGITGSYGKTSTKNAAAHILNGRFRAYATPKSYNTLMGVSLAINNDLADNYSMDYFLAEMGAYVPGEIQEICDLTRPRIGILVEIGPQHLERFGSLANTAKAKYELIQSLPADGLGVFNWDNAEIRTLYEKGYPNNRIAISTQADPAQAHPNGPRFIASDIVQTLDGLRFIVTDTQTQTQAEFITPILGQHNVTNILLATAVAVYEGMPLQDVAWRVRTLQPAESRLVTQQIPSGITVINDAYSANPVGAVEALRVLGLHTHGKRLLITPGMVELGELMAQENKKLGITAAQYATEVILVGAAQTAPIKAGLLEAGFPAEKLLTVETLAEAITWYQQNLTSGDTVLFLNDLPDTYST